MGAERGADSWQLGCTKQAAVSGPGTGVIVMEEMEAQAAEAPHRGAAVLAAFGRTEAASD